MQHLQQFLQGIIEQGGEGIILRNPSSLYEHGRSRAFLKLKTTRDAEAKIIESHGPNVWKCMLYVSKTSPLHLELFFIVVAMFRPNGVIFHSSWFVLWGDVGTNTLGVVCVTPINFL